MFLFKIALNRCLIYKKIKAKKLTKDKKDPRSTIIGA